VHTTLLEPECHHVTPDLQWVPLEQLYSDEWGQQVGEEEVDVGLLVRLREPKLPFMEPFFDQREFPKFLHHVFEDLTALQQQLLCRYI